MSITRLLILSALVFALFLLVPSDAEACTNYRCELVDHPTIQFCLKCVDTGSPTGANCFNSGSPCGCRFQMCPFSTEPPIQIQSWMNLGLESAGETCPVLDEPEVQTAEAAALAA